MAEFSSLRPEEPLLAASFDISWQPDLLCSAGPCPTPVLPSGDVVLAWRGYATVQIGTAQFRAAERMKYGGIPSDIKQTRIGRGDHKNQRN